MMEKFVIAAFRSRLQVMAFERTLRAAGVKASVVTTPRAVALGCGLSVRFECLDLERVRMLLRGAPMTNLIGLYSVERDSIGRVIVRPVHSQAGK
ncbi:MAG: DUF3343 domain-containing protein [Clostridia bacterium]|nr:DUF3343 domain-containing protein [Clostridia bacterium]